MTDLDMRVLFYISIGEQKEATNGYCSDKMQTSFLIEIMRTMYITKQPIIWPFH